MNTKKKESLFKKNVNLCENWETIAREFDQLPKPILRRDEEGEEYYEGWIFRGHKSETFRLEPSIERAYPHLGWDEAEHKTLQEFKSKARTHIDPSQIPQAEDKLGWLALMQHYAASTRLLDFTYSPYIALYFALRNRGNEQGSCAEVWGIDGAALRGQAAETWHEAEKEMRERSGPSIEGHPPLIRTEDAASTTSGTTRPGSGWRDSLTPKLESLPSSLQVAQQKDRFWDTLVSHALEPCGVCRTHFNQKGFVSMALPTVQNPRLSSQQGVFLFNGAENLHFEQSLDFMMQDVKKQWYKRFRVPEDALEEMENQLFQFNIHDLSLFPDIEGLAGFVRQKIRLDR